MEINDQIYKFFHQILTVDKSVTVQQASEIGKLKDKIERITAKI